MLMMKAVVEVYQYLRMQQYNNYKHWVLPKM